MFEGFEVQCGIARHVGIGSLVGIATLACLSGCVAPFAEMQGARMVGQGGFEATLGVTEVDNENKRFRTDVSAQFALGIGDGVDLRTRYELIAVDADEFGPLHAVEVGPKLRLRRDRLALFVPIGCGFGEGIDTSKSFRIAPTLLTSLPISRYFELTPSLKIPLWLSELTAFSAAINVGAAIGDLGRWALRPEVGVLVHADGQSALQFSLGVSFAPLRGR